MSPVDFLQSSDTTIASVRLTYLSRLPVLFRSRPREFRALKRGFFVLPSFPACTLRQQSENTHQGESVRVQEELLLHPVLTLPTCFSSRASSLYPTLFPSTETAIALSWNAQMCRQGKQGDALFPEGRLQDTQPEAALLVEREDLHPVQ